MIGQVQLQEEMHPHIKEVTSTLVKCFGRPTLGNKKNPFNELLFIILSSKTPPERYQEVYRSLRSQFPRADDLADADWRDIAQVIAQAGLQNRKARAIVAIARRLRDTYGRVTLSPLKKLTNQDAETVLVSLPKVSKKTARCVLMYSLDRHVFPVDTHCFRISRRLGWLQEETELTDRRADELQAGVPPALRHDLHVGMILLGRHYCTPNRPQCRPCPILTYCAYGRDQL